MEKYLNKKAWEIWTYGGFRAAKVSLYERKPLKPYMFDYKDRLIFSTSERKIYFTGLQMRFRVESKVQKPYYEISVYDEGSITKKSRIKFDSKKYNYFKFFTTGKKQ